MVALNSGFRSCEDETPCPFIRQRLHSTSGVDFEQGAGWEIARWGSSRVTLDKPLTFVAHLENGRLSCLQSCWDEMGAGSGPGGAGSRPGGAGAHMRQRAAGCEPLSWNEGCFGAVEFQDRPRLE